jgi:hypothetical protein
MSDNARFHNKLHRKNHHSVCTPGYPDSATDPIASAAEPFMGDFYLSGNLNVSGAINTVFSTLSNISITSPVLSASVGFKPTNSLIVQLSGIKYAIPLTFVGTNPAPATVVNSLSGATTFLNGVSVLGSLSGVDSRNWNNVYTVVIGNSAYWTNGYYAYTNVFANSANWQVAYTTVASNSAKWSNALAYSLTPAISSIFPVFGNNTASGYSSNVAGGNSNTASGDSSNVAGGGSNTASGYSSNVAGGNSNTASGFSSNVAGGGSNTAFGCYSNIAGGDNNTASGDSSNVAGGGSNTASGYSSNVAGGNSNTASGLSSNVAGGGANTAFGRYSNIAGGDNNTASGDSSNVAGGGSNTASGYSSNVAGGNSNTASGNYSNIAGGYNNNTSGNFSAIVGGQDNNINNQYSAILGGKNNSTRLSNTFILGSGISAALVDYTYVNNLSSQNFIQAASAYSTFLSVGASGVNAVLPNTIAQFFTTIAGYGQINVQNTSSGSYASTDVVVTADNGSDTQNYIDIGINSSTYASSAYSISGPNDSYIYAQSKNIAIGTASSADILLHTGGTLASNERVRITSSGCMGIGTCTPNTNLTVVGNISASGNAYFKNTVYSAGINPGSILPTYGGNTVSNAYAYIGSGCFNQATGNNSVVVGGCLNTATGNQSNILGGTGNNANGVLSVIGGGFNNNTFSNYGTILGGGNNSTCCWGTVGGGNCNAATGIYSVAVGGRNNTSSGAYSSIVGGFCNVNNGCLSFIAGGNGNNITNSICNAFILGSGINATNSGYTYVNGIIASGNITGCNINSCCINNTNTINTANLSAINTTTYSVKSCDSNTIRNSVIGGDLTVNGTIYSPFFSALTGTGSFVLSGGSKYSTVFGNNGLSSFTITHNLNTSDIVMTIIDYTTYQVVYPAVIIPNNNQVQVNFSFIPSTQYKISIIGL